MPTRPYFNFAFLHVGLLYHAQRRWIHRRRRTISPLNNPSLPVIPLFTSIPPFSDEAFDGLKPVPNFAALDSASGHLDYGHVFTWAPLGASISTSRVRMRGDGYFRSSRLQSPMAPCSSIRSLAFQNDHCLALLLLASGGVQVDERRRNAFDRNTIVTV
jgi:hypothetical protein